MKSFSSRRWQKLERRHAKTSFCRIFCSLPVAFFAASAGTFHMIADSAEHFGTKMTPEAIGISVAPFLFHSCIHEGSKVKLEDVQSFKVASQVVSQIIRSFGHTNLFPRYCYEFYVCITGRKLRFDESWLFTSQYHAFYLCFTFKQ